MIAARGAILKALRYRFLAIKNFKGEALAHRSLSRV
jgi:hypothetical protein